MMPDHKGKSVLPRRVLARIHMAKKALGLEDDDYRDLLERVTGRRSAAQLGQEDMPGLQREFRRLGWQGYLIRLEDMPPLKYQDVDERPGRPTGAQLRMLEARFRNIKGFATRDPEYALRSFLEKVVGASHPLLLDDRGYEKALTAIKRLEQARGVKEPWRGKRGD